MTANALLAQFWYSGLPRHRLATSFHQFDDVSKPHAAPGRACAWDDGAAAVPPFCLNSIAQSRPIAYFSPSAR